MKRRIADMIERMVIALTTRKVRFEDFQWNEPMPDDPDFYPYFWCDL